LKGIWEEEEEGKAQRGKRKKNIYICIIGKIFNEGHIDWLDSSSDNLGGAQCQRIVLMYEKRDRNRRGQEDKSRENIGMGKIKTKRENEEEEKKKK
jgi:hypothetical protein